MSGLCIFACACLHLCVRSLRVSPCMRACMNGKNDKSSVCLSLHGVCCSMHGYCSQSNYIRKRSIMKRVCVCLMSKFVNILLCVCVPFGCCLSWGDHDFCQCKLFECQYVPQVRCLCTTVCVRVCVHVSMTSSKSLFTYAQVLIWAFICGCEICLSWSVWAMYICGYVLVRVCVCDSASAC